MPSTVNLQCVPGSQAKAVPRDFGTYSLAVALECSETLHALPLDGKRGHRCQTQAFPVLLSRGQSHLLLGQTRENCKLLISPC